jgi:hypothetical protein
VGSQPKPITPRIIESMLPFIMGALTAATRYWFFALSPLDHLQQAFEACIGGQRTLP